MLEEPFVRRRGEGVRDRRHRVGRRVGVRLETGGHLQHEREEVGFREESLRVAEGLLRALDGFANRAPELFGGQSSDEGWPPLPYPASCRPQAWAAASAWVLAEVLGS
ncbi:hypothetical protein GCM10028820_28690 [Tessaracoccus terricola]